MLSNDMAVSIYIFFCPYKEKFRICLFGIAKNPQDTKKSSFSINKISIFQYPIYYESVEDHAWLMSLILTIAIGVLGLCAIVLSSPYDIPTYVPDALMHLCEHSHDPDIIQVCIFWSTNVGLYGNFCL
jgi:hypothetical protein